MDLRQLKPKQLAELILEKLGPRQREGFPPVVDRLFKRVRAVTSKEKERVSKIAYSFFEAFQSMLYCSPLKLDTSLGRIRASKQEATWAENHA